MKDDVKKVLDSIRPTIQADGGDVELIEVDEKRCCQTTATRCLYPLSDVRNDFEGRYWPSFERKN